MSAARPRHTDGADQHGGDRDDHEGTTPLVAAATIRAATTRDDLDALRAKLAELCRGRDLGVGARKELDRLFGEGTTDELGDVVAHLRALGPPVTPRPDAATTEAFRCAWSAYMRRADQHARRIMTLGERLGREVAAHRVTLDDAERRLEGVAFALDPECEVPIPLLAYGEAREMARIAFRRGMEAGR